MRSAFRYLMIVASAAILTAGCSQHHSKPISTTEKEEIVPAGAQPPAVAPPGAQQTAQQQESQPTGPQVVDVLARKTESYSKDMEDLLKKRSAVSAKPQPSPQESAVDWTTPRQAPDSVNVQPAKRSAPAPQIDKPSVTPAMSVSPQVVPGAGRIADANLPAQLPAPAPQAIRSQTPSSNSIDAFEAKLLKRVTDYPRDVSAQLEYQLLLFLRDQSVPQLQTLASLPTEDREIIAALMDALTNFRSGVRAENNMLLSKKIRPLSDLAERLRSQADLAIPKVALCSSVTSYGQYEPMEPRFVANGKEPQAILYCEIENFSSQLTGEEQQQQWTSELRLESVLYSDNASQVLKVWADKPETVRDVSRNRRHDFFLRKRVTLPKTLSLGRYLLKVSITDVQSNRIAETTLPIEVVAQ